MRASEQLGSASICIGGLSIWVHSHQFPELDDYWDGNWLIVTAHCAAPGAEVWVKGPIIHSPELIAWADACEAMQQARTGDGNLECMEPELSIELRMDEPGRVAMRVAITPDNQNQMHYFHFAVDPSALPDLINACRKVLVDFPLKDAPVGQA